MHENVQFKSQLENIRKKVEAEILTLPAPEKIPLFYEPIGYINRLSGKKLRPLLLVVSGLTIGGKLEDLIRPAAAIELLHNFTLVHDDIMDNDATRRGQPTVHSKWDIATAILAGDGLIGLAYQKLLKNPKKNSIRVLQIFTDAMLEICEGQALDKMFETIDSVSEDSYMEMIAKKTATLISLSCEMGALISGGNEVEVVNLAKFGFNIGMGFQIQDDLLDILADERKLGKKVGSDLAMNKKTIVSIRLKEKLNKEINWHGDLNRFKELVQKHNLISEINELANSFFLKSEKHLNNMPNNENRELLVYLAETIRNREK